MTWAEIRIWIEGPTLLIAVGWALGLGRRVKVLEKENERVYEQLQKLHDYAQEIDPRHDEERELLAALHGQENLWAGKDHHDFVQAKRERGKRTLHDPL